MTPLFPDYERHAQTVRLQAMRQVADTGIPQCILVHGGPFAFHFAVVPATTKLLPQLCASAKVIELVCAEDLQNG